MAQRRRSSTTGAAAATATPSMAPAPSYTSHPASSANPMYPVTHLVPPNQTRGRPTPVTRPPPSSMATTNSGTLQPVNRRPPGGSVHRTEPSTATNDALQNLQSKMQNWKQIQQQAVKPSAPYLTGAQRNLSAQQPLFPTAQAGVVGFPPGGFAATSAATTTALPAAPLPVPSVNADQILQTIRQEFSFTQNLQVQQNQVRELISQLQQMIKSQQQQITDLQQQQQQTVSAEPVPWDQNEELKEYIHSYVDECHNDFGEEVKVWQQSWQEVLQKVSDRNYWFFATTLAPSTPLLTSPTMQAHCNTTLPAGTPVLCHYPMHKTSEGIFIQTRTVTSHAQMYTWWLPLWIFTEAVQQAYPAPAEPPEEAEKLVYLGHFETLWSADHVVGASTQIEPGPDVAGAEDLLTSMPSAETEEEDVTVIDMETQDY